MKTLAFTIALTLPLLGNSLPPTSENTIPPVEESPSK